MKNFFWFTLGLLVAIPLIFLIGWFFRDGFLWLTGIDMHLRMDYMFHNFLRWISDANHSS